MRQRLLIIVFFFLCGAFFGTLQGAAIYYFDPINNTPIKEAKVADPAMLTYAGVITRNSWFILVFLVLASVVVTGFRKLNREQSEKYYSALSGWALAIAPFFYVFRYLP